MKQSKTSQQMRSAHRSPLAPPPLASSVGRPEPGVAGSAEPAAPAVAVVAVDGVPAVELADADDMELTRLPPDPPAPPAGAPLAVAVAIEPARPAPAEEAAMLEPTLAFGPADPAARRGLARVGRGGSRRAAGAGRRGDDVAARAASCGWRSAPLRRDIVRACCHRAQCDRQQPMADKASDRTRRFISSLASNAPAGRGPRWRAKS